VAKDKSWFKVIAEILSAVAVVASLAFLAMEVRETARQTELNTEALRVAAYQDLIGQIAQFNTTLLDPALATLYRKMNEPGANVAALSPVERVQADRILLLLVRHADMAYYQYELGFLSEARLESAVQPFLGTSHSPLYLAFWSAVKANFVPSFQAYIDARIEAG
jgi:hypothetical protein